MKKKSFFYQSLKIQWQPITSNKSLFFTVGHFKTTWLACNPLFLKKTDSLKPIKLLASNHKDLTNSKIISVLKDNVVLNIMDDPSIQKLLKDTNYINFELALRFSKADLESEIVNFKTISNTKGLIRLLNNENSLYHMLCQSILQIKNKTLTCTQVETSYQDHHIMPLHLDSTGLIQKQELDRDYNIIRIPTEFHYFLHAIRAVEYNSSKDYLTTHLHFSRLIKSVNQDLYNNTDFSDIYTEDQVNQKFFTDILKNYSIFSLKTIDFSTEEGLEKSIVSRQTDRTIELLNNDTYWTNNDVPSTQVDYHLIPAKKYTISSQLFDELIDLMPENKTVVKNKNTYQSFKRYVDLQVKKPPFKWECQEIENKRIEIESKKKNKNDNDDVSLTMNLRDDSENRRIRTHPRVLSMLDNGGYSWVNIENKNLKLHVLPGRFQNVIEMVLELFRLQNQSTTILDPHLAGKVGSIMMKKKKSAQYFNLCWDWVPDQNLALIPASNQQIKLPLDKIFEILALYDNYNLFINLHNEFKSLLVKHVHTVNYLNNATIQIEISTFREFMDTRYNINPNNLDFLKNSNSIYFQLCYYYNKNITQVNREDKRWSAYSIMPDFMNNILPVNFQIYKTQLKNPSNSFFTSLGVCYVLKILRFLEFGFSQDFKEISSIYPTIPFLKSFLESRSPSELPFNFGLKTIDYKNDRWSLIEQLIKNQITLILLFNNARTDTFKDFNFKMVDTNNQALTNIRENFFYRELIWTNDKINRGLSVTIPPYVITRVYDLVRILIAYHYPKKKQTTNKWSNAELLQNYATYMRRYLTQTGNFNSPFDGWKLKNH